MRHDTYSLGVCPLKISLWDLLVSAESPAQVSELFLRAAAGINGQSSSEAELRAKLNHPTEINNILLKIARENIPQGVGLSYYRLAIACLTGLDQPSSFGSKVDFRGMSQLEQGVAFMEPVLSFFTDISCG